MVGDVTDDRRGGVTENPDPDVAAYVVGDIHGHLDELKDALRAQGLIDDADKWAGRDVELWFLGDFVDRGPDGIGVIDFVMGLHEQSDGSVHTLLGNHEILLLGTHRFGEKQVPGESFTRSFAHSWAINGGMIADQDSLTDAHVEWLTSRPLLAHQDQHLLLHSDTLDYLDWGGTVAEINETVAGILTGEDLAAWWEVWLKMTTRYAFRGPTGIANAETLLHRLGGDRIVHGHSVISDQLGIHPTQLEGPYLYAGGKVLGVDGGLFVGGPCLVVPLPWVPED